MHVLRASSRHVSRLNEIVDHLRANARGASIGELAKVLGVRRERVHVDLHLGELTGRIARRGAGTTTRYVLVDGWTAPPPLSDYARALVEKVTASADGIRTTSLRAALGVDERQLQRVIDEAMIAGLVRREGFGRTLRIVSADERPLP